jgi:hypothetical protein
MNILIAIANIQLFPETENKNEKKMYIYTLNSYNSTDLGKVSNSVRAVI